MSNYDVVLKKVEPQLLASVRDTIPDWDQVKPTFNRLFDEVFSYVAQHGGKPAGPAFDRWHDPEIRRTDMNVEAAVPLQQPIPPSDRVAVYTLPGADTMACTIHQGPFDTLSAAHEAVVRWAQANDYRLSGLNREVYLQYEREGDPDRYVTEVQYPVERA